MELLGNLRVPKPLGKNGGSIPGQYGEIWREDHLSAAQVPHFWKGTWYQPWTKRSVPKRPPQSPPGMAGARGENHHIYWQSAWEFFKMGLMEATHMQWQGPEPHTYINGREPIYGVYHSQDLEVTAVVRLSFHEGIGDHCMVLVDITNRSEIDQQE